MMDQIKANNPDSVVLAMNDAVFAAGELAIVFYLGLGFIRVWGLVLGLGLLGSGV